MSTAIQVSVSQNQNRKINTLRNQRKHEGYKGKDPNRRSPYTCIETKSVFPFSERRKNGEILDKRRTVRGESRDGIKRRIFGSETKRFPLL